MMMWGRGRYVVGFSALAEWAHSAGGLVITLQKQAKLFRQTPRFDSHGFSQTCMAEAPVDSDWLKLKVLKQAVPKRHRESLCLPQGERCPPHKHLSLILARQFSGRFLTVGPNCLPCMEMALFKAGFPLFFLHKLPPVSQKFYLTTVFSHCKRSAAPYCEECLTPVSIF